MADLQSQVEKRSNDSEKGIQNRMLLRTLREGEQAMRNKATVYLPQEKNETNEDYEYRKDNRTSLYSGTEKSIDDINNRIFSKEVTFESEDQELNFMIKENFTGTSEGINEFAKNFNLDALWNGGAFALVNFDTGLTFENDPYVLMIDIDNVYDMRFNEKGKMVLFKYMSEVEESVDLFNTVSVKYMYLYYVDNTDTVYLQTYKMVDGEDDYILEGEVALPERFNDIPVVGLYPNTRTKNLNPDRPYQTMAFKNRTHWVYNSIYMQLVNIASSAFLFANGIRQNKNPIKFGIKAMYVTEDSNSDIKWVQADTKSADMIRTFLEDLKEEMKMLGSEFLETKQVMTATQAVINTADTSSKASTFAQNLEDALIKIIDFMLLWKNINIDYTIMVNKNVGITKDREAFDIANQLNDKNVLSDKDLRIITGALGYLPTDISEEEYLENLEDEGKLFNANFVTETGQEVIIDDENEEDFSQQVEEEV